MPGFTRKGVKAVDIAWCPPEIWRESVGKPCLVRAPELFVGVVSPSNTASEINEKRRLYSEAGAREVWLFGEDGKVEFLGPGGALPGSERFPGFPKVLEG